ncbi:hypothetical protein BURMUCGD1_6577 [Burkholderia multivorans CGD1]|nr:hypothetical protein BURMUCGD1_6577 [Burkholderia multivorans CGD1]
MRFPLAAKSREWCGRPRTTTPTAPVDRTPGSRRVGTDRTDMCQALPLCDEACARQPKNQTATPLPQSLRSTAI